MDAELTGCDAIALGDLIRKGQISPVELLETTIQRIEKINPQLNFVIHRMYDQAHEAAKSWTSKIKSVEATKPIFCGVPFLLKDLIAEFKGAPFNEGSCAVKGYVSKTDSELVKRQKDSGLIITSKDLITADKVGATILGYPPECVPHISLAMSSQKRVMDLADLDIKGDVFVDEAIKPLKYIPEQSEAEDMPQLFEAFGVKCLLVFITFSIVCWFDIWSFHHL